MVKYIFLILFSFPAFAASPAPAPQCNMQNNGIVHCFADRMCKCEYVSPGLLTNDPGGYRWDCGITRPACIDPNQIDSSRPYDGPQAVGIDKSTETNINSEVGDNSPAEFNINPSTTIRPQIGDEGTTTIEVNQ